MILRHKLRKQKKKNPEIETPIFLGSVPEGIEYLLPSDIEICDGYFYALSDDPNITLRISVEQTAISVSLSISSENTECVSAIYYSNDEIMNFSEEKKIIIGKADGKAYDRNIVFSSPVHWIRFDSVDQAGKFSVNKFHIRVTDPDTLGTAGEEITFLPELSIEDTINALSERITSQNWRADDFAVFVTHDISGTGAPLLCRKMSAFARKAGKHTVIISLAPVSSSELIQQFQQDCDVLLILMQSAEIERVAQTLAKLGIKLAVLNTVVSGSALKYFHEAGFKTICLIHEMQGALKLLQAQRWIEDFALYADRVVFPAACVRDEFIRFGGNVGDKSVILPQGYYKAIETKPDSALKSRLLGRFNIPEGAKLIAGAGTINFRKGVDLLPLIAKELKKLGPADYHFLWLGTSDDAAYDIFLQDQIIRMGLADRFHFTGYIADEKEYMDIFGGCDALALVSREDPYPSVMIEAMAAGTPVVAFMRSGGAEELLADERGYLVDYLDISQYALTLHRICNEHGFADDVRMRAKEYVRRYCDFSEYVDKIINM